MTPIFISLARMHHLSNPSKYRRLRRFAEQCNISGFVKTGKPGILVFDGTKECNRTFLEHVKGLRYLDFHHLDTKLLSKDGSVRLAGGTKGLDELDNTSEIVMKLQTIGEKEWFRRGMGMQRD